MRVAGILTNVVPYHHARWEAFTVRSGTECHVVELTNRDAFKVLEFSATASYHRHTLYPQGGDMISDNALRRAMATLLDSLCPEVVCVSGWALPVSLAALDWAVRRRVPVVILSESNEFDQSRFAPKEWVKRRIVSLCSAGLAGGNPQADYLVKLGLPQDAVELGYDAVDNGYFAAESAKWKKLKAEIRVQKKAAGLEGGRTGTHAMCPAGAGERAGGRIHTEDGVQGADPAGPLFAIHDPLSTIPHPPYFLACCRFGKKKNVPRLIEAYAGYVKSCRLSAEEGLGELGRRLQDETTLPWPLVVVGDGEMRVEIEATIARCGVGRRVHLAGLKSYAEIAEYYALAGAFIHASTTEQWGLVVNEAMACGLPVLISKRVGCAQDLVQDGVNGFTFDPYDMEQLAQLMVKVSAAGFPLSAFGDASRTIIADWGPERFAAGLKQAVDCALKIGPKRATMLQRLILKTLQMA